MVKGQKKKLTPAQKAAKRQRQNEYMTIFVNGKQKRVKRPITIDGLSEEDFIKRNADPIWLHQNELWEYMEVETISNLSALDSETNMGQTRLLKLFFQYVSASESGDYFQLLFEDDDSNSNSEQTEGNYLLISRQFEFPDNDKLQFESLDLDFCGEYEIIRAELKMNHLVLEIKGDRNYILEINFEASRQMFTQIESSIKTMIPSITVSSTYSKK